MNRIDTIDPNFSLQFKSATLSNQQRAVSFAVKNAIEKSDLTDSIFFEALKQFKNRQTLVNVDYLRIEKLGNEFDEEYFKLQEECNEKYIEYFNKARAAFALVYALKAKTDDDYLESIYESLIVFNDQMELLENLKSILKK